MLEQIRFTNPHKFKSGSYRNSLTQKINYRLHTQSQIKRNLLDGSTSYPLIYEFRSVNMSIIKQKDMLTRQGSNFGNLNSFAVPT